MPAFRATRPRTGSPGSIGRLGDGADAVILELGANDMLQGIDPAVTRKMLDTILARLKARHIKVLIAGMRATPSLGTDYVQAFDHDLSRAGGKISGAALSFLPRTAWRRTRLCSLSDGMHPNRAGVERSSRAFLPQVETLLRTSQKP